MDHSQAKRYAVSMILKRLSRDIIDIARPNFLVEIDPDDRQKIEGCLIDIHDSLKPSGLTIDDIQELGFITSWLKDDGE